MDTAPGPSPETQRATHEAAATATRHHGPTADRFGSTLERYLGVVADDQPPPVASPKFRFAAPRTVAGVMSREVHSVPLDAPVKEVARALDANDGRAVPVLDEAGQVAGVVTTSDLLARIAGTVPKPRSWAARRGDARRKRHAQTAGELMSAPPITTTPNASVAAAARFAARSRVRCLPVIDNRGRLVGLVSRDDLARVFLRPDDQIRRDVQADVDMALRARHDKHGNTVTVTVADGVVTLTGEVESGLLARRLVHHAEQVVGVIGVHDLLDFRVKDTFLLGPP